HVVEDARRVSHPGSNTIDGRQFLRDDGRSDAVPPQTPHHARLRSVSQHRPHRQRGSELLRAFDSHQRSIPVVGIYNLLAVKARVEAAKRGSSFRHGPAVHRRVENTYPTATAVIPRGTAGRAFRVGGLPLLDNSSSS